jgi:hypothetical protein
LLFNGARGSVDYFEASTAGDDMSLTANLGNAPLKEVTAIKAFNFQRVHSFDLYSRFTENAKVKGQPHLGRADQQKRYSRTVHSFGG